MGWADGVKKRKLQREKDEKITKAKALGRGVGKTCILIYLVLTTTPGDRYYRRRRNSATEWVTCPRSHN